MNKDIQLIFEAYCESTFDFSRAVDISDMHIYRDSGSTIASTGGVSDGQVDPETAPIGDESVEIYQARFNAKEWPDMQSGALVKWNSGVRGLPGGTDNTFATNIKQGLVVGVEEFESDESVLIIKEMPIESGTMPDLKPRE